MPCPVGRHWSLVTPVKESELAEDERRIAAETRDIRIPLMLGLSRWRESRQTP